MKVLVLSNMYPSKKYPHYGIFVKNTSVLLENLGFSVSECYIQKQDKKIKKIIEYIKFFIVSFSKCLFGKYDYIYVHYPAMTSLSVLMVSKIKKLENVIVNIHGNDLVPESEKDKKYIKYTVNSVRIAKKILVPSQYFKDRLLELDVTDSDNVYVFPSGGVDKNIFFELNKEEAVNSLKLKTGKKYIGYASRIEKNKGWDLFLKAMKQIIDKHPDYHIVVVGGGSEKLDFDELVTELNLREHITSFNFLTQSDLNCFFNVLDIFVFPTRRESESLGLVGLEAMASGTLVVASDKFGPSSYMRDGINGFTFNPFEVDSLVEVLVNILENNILYYEDLRHEGMKTVEEYVGLKNLNILREVFYGES